MGDPLSLVLDLAKGLLSRVKDVKNNHEECQFLEDKIEQTLTILERLEGRVFDFPTNTVLELVRDALINAKDEVDKCCNTSLINSVLYTDSQALDLKHATEKLEHALSQVSLAQLGIAADMQSDMVDLATQIRTTKFQEGARAAYHARDVKSAVEKASKQNSQENAEIKNLIKQFLLERSWSIKEIKEELACLQQELDQLKHKGNEEKEKEEVRRALEVETIIGVLSQSLAHAKKASGITPDLEDSLRCPLSNEIVRDPVMLKESEKVYDRSSINKWFDQGYQHDPVSNVKLESKDLVPIPIFRVASQSVTEQHESHSSIMNTTQGEESQQSIEPGLYEGQGRLLIGSKKARASQLLILEPNGGVVGCTLYKEHGCRGPGNNTDIGAGKFDGNLKELSFVDNRYNYCGIVECLGKQAPTELQWKPKVSNVDNPTKDYSSTLFYSSPIKRPTGLLCPTILQCEGSVDTSMSQFRYRSKLVLSLEEDSTISGWTYFESSMQEAKIVGHVREGTWKESGQLTFSFGFSNGNTQSKLDSIPLSYTNVFNVVGTISHDEKHGLLVFNSVIAKALTEGIVQKSQRPTPLNGLTYWKYPSLHEVSALWHPYGNPSKLFQVSRNLEFERSQHNLLAKVDVEHPLGLQLRHKLEWSSLHIASEDNSASNIKEKIANGVDVNQQQKGGQTLLHLASSNNLLDMIIELIANDADVGAQDENGWTPLHIASQKNNVKIVQKLIANGANINVQDNKGSAPIHLASYENSFDVVKELIGGGAKVGLQDNIGRTPLHIAAKRGQTSIVRILLENGASKDVRNAAGMTPYDFVCVGRCLLPFAKDTIEELKAILEA